MLQLICIMVLLSSLGFAQNTKEKPKKIVSEQLKTFEQNKQKVLQAAQKVAAQSQPDYIYNDYIKNEKMVPNLEPVKDRIYGSRTARNKLVVFADFACGHCKVSSKELKARVDENKDLVNLTYVFFPLDKECNNSLKGKLSDYSCFSARLALCAEKNGKVWQGIDYLYEKQDEGRSASLNRKKFIKNMGTKLKISKLDACVNSKWAEDKLVTEQLVHKGLKIPGTPTIILNNKGFGPTYKSSKIFSDFIKYLDLKEHPEGK